MKIISKYSNFLVESIKDNIPSCGWKKITSTEYWTNELKSEKFTKEELDFLNSYTEHIGFPEPVVWNFGCSWQIKKKEEFKITIMKFEEEWFIVKYENDEPFFYRPEEWFIVDQNGIREENYGLKDLLNYIVTQLI